MTLEEAQEYAKTMSYTEAVYNALEGRAVPYKKATKIKLDELLKSANELDEPKTGHWIERAQYSDGKHKIGCSECGNYIFDRGHANSLNVKNKYKYCPNCGAKMVKPESEE